MPFGESGKGLIMKSKGPRAEKETVIIFNQKEDDAYIWTASDTTYRRLLKLGYVPIEDGERSADFKIPKKYVGIRKPAATSEKRLKALERARANAKARYDEKSLTVQRQIEQDEASLGDS